MDEPQRDQAPAADLVAHVQDAMLPDSLPVPQGAAVAGRYLLADDAAVAGGDWFDAIVLDDGRIVVCVGDVTGSGPEAATAMGELRAVFGDRVRDHGDLAGTVVALDRRTSWAPEGRGATICAAILDPRTGELTYGTAGHPPPVVVDHAGHASYLPVTGGPPLGAVGSQLPTATHQLEVGDVVLLYSDGLLDRPGCAAGQSAAELLRVLTEAVTGAGNDADEPLIDRVCRDAIDVLTGRSGYCDDIAVLALQRTELVAPLRLRLPAIADSARVARANVGDWLRRLHITVLDDLSVRHAVSELVANAVEHAYDEPGVQHEVRVTVQLRADGLLEMTVADDGLWREPTANNDSRGRGLAIVRGFTDELQVDRGRAGTCVLVRHRLCRPAAMLRAVGGTSPGLIHGPDFSVHVDGTRVRASGNVEGEAAAQLQRTLDRSSQGGTRPVDVDLSEVSLLGSAGVQVLVEARAAGDVRLIAPVGSAAQHVLELVRVPYES